MKMHILESGVSPGQVLFHCFVMGINKSLGQIFKDIGVDISVSCFAHGQFYVTASRKVNATMLSILAPNNNTRTVVYPEVIQYS